MTNMLSKALRAMRGPLDQLIANLGSEQGEEWFTEFKKFLRKEPCWVPSPGKSLVVRQELVTPFSDTGLPPHLLGLAQKWHELAEYISPGYKGPVAWEYQNMIMFWIPRLVPGSMGKTASEQMKLLAGLRKQFELPEHHLTKFGAESLLKVLIWKHFELTGEKVPLGHYWVRTDLCDSDGHRLSLFWSGFSLYCSSYWGENRRGSMGAFALGVEALGT